VTRVGSGTLPLSPTDAGDLDGRVSASLLAAFCDFEAFALSDLRRAHVIGLRVRGFVGDDANNYRLAFNAAWSAGKA